MSATITPTRRGALASVSRAIERNLLRIAIWHGERALQRMQRGYHLVSVAAHRSRDLQQLRVRLALLEAA